MDQTNPDELARTRPKAEFDAIARRFIRDLVEGKSVNSRMPVPLKGGVAAMGIGDGFGVPEMQDQGETQ